MQAWTAIVTIVSLMVYLWTLFGVGQARGRYKVDAPAMTGPPEFERAVRIQANTIEGLVAYLPSLWLFSAFVDARIAAALGVVWIVGRVLYARGYAKDPATRSTGFLIQGVATLALLLGALGGAVWTLVRA